MTDTAQLSDRLDAADEELSDQNERIEKLEAKADAQAEQIAKALVLLHQMGQRITAIPGAPPPVDEQLAQINARASARVPSYGSAGR
jgi:septal ring factor EnvC (AmiA/AmiB activator)